jgi:hypothetical protein
MRGKEFEGNGTCISLGVHGEQSHHRLEHSIQRRRFITSGHIPFTKPWLLEARSYNVGFC